MKTALITGSTGYLGKHLIPVLHKLNILCRVSNTTEGNLLKYKNLKQFNNIDFDYIFHLAAYTKAGDFCLFHPYDQWLINDKINHNIIRYWVENQPQAKFIGMGTSCSYDPNLPMIEENYLDGKLDKDLFAYATTKRTMLVGLQAAYKQWGLNYLYFIPSTIYGPNFTRNDNHFIYDIVRKIKHAKETNTKAVLWGSGFQSRDLVYITDVINAMIKATITDNLPNEIINLSSGVSMSIGNYAIKICKLLDFDFKNVIFNQSAYQGVWHKKLIIDKAKKLGLLDNITDFDLGILNLLSC